MKPRVHSFVRKRQQVNDALAQQKLALEVRDLRRSQWARPVVIVPILVTAITVALSQYLGVFDVERKRIEVVNASADLRNREAELRYREIEIDRAQSERELLDLNLQREELHSERQRLVADRDQLLHDISDLREQTQQITSQAYRTENIVKEATAASNRLVQERLGHESKSKPSFSDVRFDRAVVMLADPQAAKRQAAVMAIRASLSEENDVYHLHGLLALTAALVWEDSVGVRAAIVATVADAARNGVKMSALRETLDALAEANRTLFSDIRTDPNRYKLALDRQRRTDANLQATAHAIAELLRQGVRSKPLAIYLGEVDLSGATLVGINFDGSTLWGSNFSNANLKGASFEDADIRRANFQRADLRDARLTYSRREAIAFMSWIHDKFALRASVLGSSFPSFRCTDLRGADFTGQPLIAAIPNDEDEEQALLSSTSFKFANLEGANIRQIRAYTSSQSAGSPFSSTSIIVAGRKNLNVTLHLGAISVQASDDFSESLSAISSAFVGTNWQAAHLPDGLEHWFERHPPPTNDGRTQGDSCGRRRLI